MSHIDESGGPLAYACAKAAPFLSKAAADRSLTQADLEKFQAAVTDYLRSPTTREHLNDDIKNLTDIVMSTETCFADIYYQMTRIDNKKLLLDQEGHFIDFAPKWRVLHDEYTFLMTESQLTATKISSKINDLLEVILPIVQSDLTLNIKQNSLDKYIKGLEIFQVEGRKNSARFSRLRHNVDVFRKNVKEVVAEQKEDVGRKIKKLDKKIAKLQADLESSSQFFAACWDVLKFSTPGVVTSAGATVSALGAMGSIGGISSLCALAPAVGVGILVIGFIALGFSILKGVKERAEQRQAKKKELAALQEEHEAIIYKDHQLKEVLDQMCALETDFDHITSRLSSIQGIWNMLVTDAQRLHYLLSSLKVTDDAQVFELTAREVTVTYETLRLALDQYSLAVAK